MKLNDVLREIRDIVQEPYLTAGEWYDMRIEGTHTSFDPYAYIAGQSAPDDMPNPYPRGSWQRTSFDCGRESRSFDKAGKEYYGRE